MLKNITTLYAEITYSYMAILAIIILILSVGGYSWENLYDTNIAFNIICNSGIIHTILASQSYLFFVMLRKV